MSDVKWIKIVTNIFDDEKILLIESLPSADSIIVIWFKLLCLAGKNNNNGVFIMSDKIAYTDEMLATIFRRDVNTVRLALKTFETYGMIEIIDGVITIPNWGKHQNFDKIEQKTAYMKEYMRDYREKQKKKIECKSNCKTNSKSNSKSNVSEADIDNIVVSKDTTCQTQSVRRVTEKWNELSQFGIKGISKLSSNSKRYTSLTARIKQYGEDKVVEAIEKIKESDFLQGKNKHGWAITFDWFVLPNNFPKVLDGNYDNRKNDGSYQNGTAEMLEDSYKMFAEWAKETEGNNDAKRIYGNCGGD